MSYYGNVAEADTYLAEYKFDSSEVWGPLSDAQKLVLMRMGTSYIDHLNFAGEKTEAGQALEFPRGTDTTVPTDIERACYECAFAIADGRDIEYESEQANTAIASYAGMKTSQIGGVSEAVANGIPSFVAWRYLKPYLRDNRGVKLVRVS